MVFKRVAFTRNVLGIACSETLSQLIMNHLIWNTERSFFSFCLHCMYVLQFVLLCLKVLKSVTGEFIKQISFFVKECLYKIRCLDLSFF